MPYNTYNNLFLKFLISFYASFNFPLNYTIQEQTPHYFSIRNSNLINFYLTSIYKLRCLDYIDLQDFSAMELTKLRKVLTYPIPFQIPIFQNIHFEDVNSDSVYPDQTSAPTFHASMEIDTLEIIRRISLSSQKCVH